MTQQLVSVDGLEIKKKISELRKKIQDCESEISELQKKGDGYHLEKCTNCGRHSDADYYGIEKNSIPSGDIIL